MSSPAMAPLLTLLLSGPTLVAASDIQYDVCGSPMEPPACACCCGSKTSLTSLSTDFDSCDSCVASVCANCNAPFTEAVCATSSGGSSTCFCTCNGAKTEIECGKDCPACAGTATCTATCGDGTSQTVTKSGTCTSCEADSICANNGGCGSSTSETTVTSNPCFARDTLAELADGSLVSMASLRSGDLVKDGPSSYTRVIVNQHAAVSLKSTLLKIVVQQRPNNSDEPNEHNSLSITPDHVLSLDGEFAPAREVTPGSKLGDDEVLGIDLTVGEIVNPLTSSGKILAQGGILASTYPEWIAYYMLNSKLIPLPLSVSNGISYCLPATTQAYYDAVVESWVTRYHPSHLKAALPMPLVPVAFILGDFLLSAGFVAFSLASPTGLAAIAAAIAAIAAAKKAGRA